MQTQYNVLGYSTDLHFHDYKLTIEIDENGDNDRNIDYKIKKQKAIEEELACSFIRSDSDKEELDIFRSINEMLRHIKQSTKKTLINKISTRLLGLEFKSYNIIKLNAMNFFCEKMLPDYN